jgi:dienelactone hydrolase|tara:strand:+ start:141 stop:1034 length:894 start_codon:yes stop_codon:yes gene_type:complete
MDRLLFFAKGSTMLADLVEVTTEDGIALGGAYFAPTGTPSQSPVEAVCLFHGDSGHFYGSLYLALGEHLAEHGIALLSANRRGHDTIANGTRGGPPKGYAFESVAESPLDYTAWLGLLRSKGHTRLALGGHSGGAVRAVYAQSREQFPDVAAVLAVSPGEYDHAGLIDLHGERFVNAYQQAESEVAAGQSDNLLTPGIPWGCTWSSAAFLDCFNPDSRYSVCQRIKNVSCPTLFVFGALECEPDGDQALPVCGAAMRQLTKTDQANVSIEVIEGANHGYEGQQTTLFDTVHRWLVQL